MAFIVADRVKETTLTSGTGSVVLNGANSGFQSFASGIGNGNSTYYVIENKGSWEVGIGTYSSATNSLSRDTVLRSSAGGGKISLTGVSTVFCTYPATKSVHADPVGFVDISAYSGVKFVDATITNSGAFFNNVTSSGNLTLQPYSQGTVPLNIVRTSSGVFFHAYKDDAYDRPVTLYTNGNTSPEWRLGLKSTPNNVYEAPSFGYVYGEDGKVGLFGNNSTKLDLLNTSGLYVTHQSNVALKVTSNTGVYINSLGNAYPALSVNGGPSLSAPILSLNNYAGSVLTVVDPQGRVGVKTASPAYDLDVNGSGRFTVVHPTSGISFSDGSFQSSAGKTYSAGSGLVLVDTTFHALATVTSGDIAALVASGIAISGWSKSYTDASVAAVSGWNKGYTDASVAAVSGWTGTEYVSLNDTYDNPSWLNSISVTKLSGVVDSSNLPSYVDDVVEYSTSGNFPVTGETGKIYIATDNNRSYRWSGSAYFQLTDTTAIWGEITGNIANQTDLTSYITSVASGSYVPYTGAIQNVNLGTRTLSAGSGTFNNSIQIYGGSSNNDFLRTDTGGNSQFRIKSDSRRIVFGDGGNAGNIANFGANALGQLVFNVGTGDSVIAGMTWRGFCFYGRNQPVYFGSTSIEGPNGVALTVPSDNILEQRNLTAAQTYRIYNTFTDASNYERGVLDWSTTSNVLRIGTEAAGTGTVRNIYVVGGNVSVGVPSYTPTRKFTVYNLSDCSIVADSDSGAGNSYFTLRNIGYLWHVGLDRNDSNKFKISHGTGWGNDAGNSNALTINTSGYIGIGTTSPTSRLHIAETWNNLGTTFTGILANITDTASASASLLMDLQVGGSSKARIDKNGVFANSVGINSAIIDSVSSFGTARIANSSGSISIYASAAGLSNGAAVQIHWLGAFGVPVSGFYGWLPGSDLTAQADTRIFRDASGILAQRNGTNAQTFRIYNTFTDASNYERGQLAWESNEFRIGSAAAGTGIQRSVVLGRWDGAGTWSPAITVNTDNSITFNGIPLKTIHAKIFSNPAGHHIFYDGQDVFGLTVNHTNYDPDTASFISNSRSILAAQGVVVFGNNTQYGGDVAIKRTAANTLSVLRGNLSTAGNFIAGAATFSSNVTIAETFGFNMGGSGVQTFRASGSGYHSWTTLGVERYGWYSDRFVLANGSRLAFSGTGVSAEDVFLARDAANTLAQRNSTAAQIFRIYNTFTDASNYERGQLAWESNEFRIGATAAGTGTQRSSVLGIWTSAGVWHPSVVIGNRSIGDPNLWVTGSGGMIRMNRTGLVDMTLGEVNGDSFAIRNNGDSSVMFVVNATTKAATFNGQLSINNGSFAVDGDARNISTVLRNKTTNTTPTTLFVNGSSTRLTIPSGKLFLFTTKIIGVKSDGSARACYIRKGSIINVAGATSLIGSIETVGTDVEDDPNLNLTITADDTNDALDIQVTGITGETWRWVAVVEGVEVAYGT